MSYVEDRRTKRFESEHSAKIYLAKELKADPQMTCPLRNGPCDKFCVCAEPPTIFKIISKWTVFSWRCLNKMFFGSNKEGF